MENKKYPQRWWRHWLSAPFIWMQLIPLVIADIFLEIYHRICFPLYGLPYVKRSRYIRIWDRPQLKYLKGFDKIACAYCGYGNGWLHYASEIAGRTEKYWCGIKHNQYKGFIAQKHQKDFLKYGDEKAFKKYTNKNDKN